jgi:hypothetical protein
VKQENAKCVKIGEELLIPLIKYVTLVLAMNNTEVKLVGVVKK